MKWLAQFSRKRLLKRVRRINRRVIQCSPGKGTTVGVLWHEENREAFQFLQEYFRGKGCMVRDLCYSEAKVATGSGMITKKQTNWLGFPVGSTTKEFTENQFDLLVNTTTQPCFPLEVITGLSVARFKLGWDYNQSGFYDLSVDVTSRPESLYLAEQLIFYLQTFNK